MEFQETKRSFSAPALIFIFILIHPVSAQAETPGFDVRDMIFLPEQCFSMGSDEYAAEAPEHRVCLSPFYLDRFEVDQRRFREVMGYNPSESKGDSKPAENVTWIEADAYCRKLGKRLPSEAEWELAARGGSRSSYSWGMEMDSAYGWYGQNSHGSTHPVGQKKPNALGFHDMNGNVWEWVADWYRAEYYETLAQSPTAETNPQGPPTGQFILIRGGSFEDGPFFLRSASRYWYEPTIKNRSLGFRCAANKPQPQELEQ